MLSILAKSGKKMSELIKPIARYAQSGEINFRSRTRTPRSPPSEGQLRPGHRGRAKIDELDGVTIDCFARDGWWCNVRKSNTEPLLRLNAEAKDRKTLDEEDGGQ
jgi:phosphomannomutase